MKYISIIGDEIVDILTRLTPYYFNFISFSHVKLKYLSPPLGKRKESFIVTRWIFSHIRAMLNKEGGVPSMILGVVETGALDVFYTWLVLSRHNVSTNFEADCRFVERSYLVSLILQLHWARYCKKHLNRPHSYSDFTETWIWKREFAWLLLFLKQL